MNTQLDQLVVQLVRMACGQLKDRLERGGQLDPPFFFLAFSDEGVALGRNAMPNIDLSSMSTAIGSVLEQMQASVVLVVHDAMIEPEGGLPYNALVFFAATEWFKRLWLMRYTEGAPGKVKCGPLERLPDDASTYMEEAALSLWRQTYKRSGGAGEPPDPALLN